MKRICVFCGAKAGHDPRWRDLAQATGRALARRGLGLVYGGGGIGLMGELAQSAMAAGGEVMGIIPRSLIRQEVGAFAITHLDVVDTMAERKMLMLARADGFLVLPGGLGTLDELFEVLTLHQIGLHDKPIAIVDADGYYAPLRAMLDRFVEAGFVLDAHVAHVGWHADPEAALDFLAQAGG
ncbi:MAG: TIGR00730 family Rossman fold protein [Burkholderiaceae bacterium]